MKVRLSTNRVRSSVSVPSGINKTTFNELINRVYALETAMADLSGVTSDISDLQTRMATIESDTEALTSLALQNQADINSLKGRVTTAENSLTALTTRVGTAEGNISAATSDISSLKTRMTTAEGNITILQTTVDNLPSQIVKTDGNKIVISDLSE